MKNTKIELFKNCNFKCNEKKWAKFREVAKENNSDASKVLRNFIDYYISKENLSKKSL